MRIVYLDLDALTPSHLSCYGYHRQTSPTIDAIARRGTRCTGVYCSDAPCLPSRTAFYQGRFGIQTGVVGHNGTAADVRRQGPTRGFRSTYEEDCFPRQLQKLGYHTAMISQFGQRHAAHQYYAGFNEIHNTGRGGAEIAYEVQPHVERWLQQHAGDDNWYLHVNYWDIHTPYRTPADFGDPFANEPVADWYTDALLKRHIARGGPHSAQDLGMYKDGEHEAWPRVPKRITDRASLIQWINGYDTAIRYVDDQIARAVALLEAAGVYEETAIIISADHGENQGELGIYGEHGTADHGTCNIPMIVKWPGCRENAVDDALHYHLDWAPTCMELLDATENVPTIWDGVSYAATLTTGQACGRDELVISQCAHVCQRSVRFGPWLYVRTIHDGLHPFAPHMLFNLMDDPHEQHDVAADHPDVLREASWRLSNWHDAQMLKMIEQTGLADDPLWTVMREGGPFHARADGSTHQPRSFTDYLQRLRDTGRAAAADALVARYGDAP